MATYDNFHSRLVSWTKIVLPLSALVLLSTLFLFARGGDSESTIPIVEIDALAREQGITAPQFAGVTNDGSIIQLSASTAKPDGTSALTIQAPLLQMNASDGTSLTIRAGTGVLNSTSQQAELTGLARLEASSGYIMETAGLTADLSQGRFNSHGPLEIQSPYGALAAGQVEIFSADSDLGQQMHFTKGVKLVYTPSIDDL